MKDRLNGCRNPYAHLHDSDITMEIVAESAMLWDPNRYDETCPSSDGACAMVIAAEDIADAAPQAAWIHATVMRTEPTTFAGRDQATRRQAGTPQPRCGATRASPTR